MSRPGKLLARLRPEQFSGWIFDDLLRELLHVGFREVSSSGSHRTLKHSGNPRLLTIPYRAGEMPKGYPREALKRIKQLEERNDDHSEITDASTLHGAPVDD